MNKYTKGLATLIFVGAFIITFVPAHASPPMLPAPTCNITGVIKSVEFKNLPTIPGALSGEVYYVDVEIDSVSLVSNAPGSDTSTCEDMYPVNSQRSIIFQKYASKTGQIPVVGRKINGTVRSGSYDGSSIVGQFQEADIQTPAVIKVITLSIISVFAIGVTLLLKR